MSGPIRFFSKEVRSFRATVATGALLMLWSCSGVSPVLYPNTHLKTVGEDVAQKDIEACRDMAEEAGARERTGRAGQVATDTAVGAGIGAASGAVGGAISGAAGQGSMIGAASGAVWGLLSGLFRRGGSQPNQAYVNFVNRCLGEKGYEVSGWQ
jgi:Glycine-zipper domain